MQLCPVCATNQLTTGQAVCSHCVQQYRTSCLYVASYLSDLYQVATKAASVARKSQLSSSSGYAPIPIRIKAWETYNRIIAHIESVAQWNNIRFSASADYTTKLIVLRNIDVFESDTYVQEIRGFISLAKDMHTMLTPIDDKTYIGNCPTCHTSLWAAQDQTLVTCSKCGKENNATAVKASTLRSLYNTTYESTIAELVEWLKSWGIKTSKRTIQRWCNEGKIHAQNIDARGTKLFKVGDVLKNIKMARNS